MLNLQELEKVYWFNGLNNVELKQLTKIVDKKSCAKGEVIFQQHQPANYFYLVKHGAVNLRQLESNPHPDYKSQHISNILGEGAYLGNFSLLPEATYFNTAKAFADCELLAFDRAEFNRLAKQNPGCGVKILKSIIVCLCQLLLETNEEYVDMVDYMIDGELYASRPQNPITAKMQDQAQTGSRQLTEVKERDLKEIPFFMDFNVEERKQLTKIITGCEYRAGEYVFNEHSLEQRLYIIQDGLVKISKMVQKDKTTTLFLLKKSQLFDVLSLLMMKRHSATAQAIKDSKLLVLEKSDFEKLLDQESICSLKFMFHICQEVYKLLIKIEQDYNSTTDYAWEKGSY